MTRWWIGFDYCREHLGVLQGQNDVDVTDPVSEDFYSGVMMKTATSNTDIYEKVCQTVNLQKPTRVMGSS